VSVLACLLVALGCAAPVPATTPRAACPPGGGTILYVRAGELHAVSLASCTDSVAGKAPAARQVAGVRTSGARAKTQRIWVHGKLVFSQVENGPVEPIKLSGDGRWLFFAIDSYGSSSIAADGLDLLVVSTGGGIVHHLGLTLVYPDYLTWCGGRLVYAAGGDRIAVHGKRLLVAAPPDWKPHPLWSDRARTFASPACSPDRTTVAVLSQRSSVNARFFGTRWQLWRVGLDGLRSLIDAPPAGSADEQPVWSSRDRSIAFVRERNGYGQLMVYRSGALYGPVARLGYQLGYYGHHDWGLAWVR
jgi:hypothetical protein